MKSVIIIAISFVLLIPVGMAYTESSSEIIPDPTPELTPEPTPEIIPELIPEPTPELIPELIPKPTPELVEPKPTPEPTPELEQIVCPQGFEPVNGECPDKPVIETTLESENLGTVEETDDQIIWLFVIIGFLIAGFVIFKKRRSSKGE